MLSTRYKSNKLATHVAKCTCQCILDVGKVLQEILFQPQLYQISWQLIQYFFLLVCKTANTAVSKGMPLSLLRKEILSTLHIRLFYFLFSFFLFKQVDTGQRGWRRRRQARAKLHSAVPACHGQSPDSFYSRVSWSSRPDQLHAGHRLAGGHYGACLGLPQSREYTGCTAIGQEDTSGPWHRHDHYSGIRRICICIRICYNNSLQVLSKITFAAMRQNLNVSQAVGGLLTHNNHKIFIFSTHATTIQFVHRLFWLSLISKHS